MTTTVIVQAHTPEGMEVAATMFEDGEEPKTTYISDGESAEFVVFGTRQISIQEEPIS